MKRIILIPLLLFTLGIVLMQGITAAAAEGDTATAYQTLLQQQAAAQQNPYYDASCAQAALSIARVEARMDALQASADACFKTGEIDKLKLEIYSEVEEKTSMILGRMLAVLLVFSVFFFSILFVFKGKGWL